MKAETKVQVGFESVMSPTDIIRAWKDEAYRLRLTAEQRARLPENPAGLIELTDADLDHVTGAALVRTRYGCNW